MSNIIIKSFKDGYFIFFKSNSLKFRLRKSNLKKGYLRNLIIRKLPRYKLKCDCGHINYFIFKPKIEMVDCCANCLQTINRIYSYPILKHK